MNKLPIVSRQTASLESRVILLLLMIKVFIQRKILSREYHSNRIHEHTCTQAPAAHTSICMMTDCVLQKVKTGMGSPDWYMSMVDIHLRELLWVYCPRHAGVKGNDRADRLAGKAACSSGLLLGRSEVLRSLTETLPAGTKPKTSHHRSPGGEGRG